ncbi:type II toxin-antitoxin system HipA family toxin [Alcaligenes aquatilis]|uniref:type II toxin-antitoxin system HipA family toxin n=1 Tax=Alcaligenes aquatilis TaxID=323284 RepID=UPI001EEF9F13|nr:type II toxin-antitoxin system HipA family toxin [Alcaligenes aquatilis]
MSISKPLYVYLQRPDTGQWVTVGRYIHDSSAKLGQFMYAPSYQDAGLPWSIDPVNLPLSGSVPIQASRYGGLHDALRDACPDAWGRLLIQRQHGLSDSSPNHAYLLKAGNAERWGALAVGSSPKPSIAELSAPPIAEIEKLSAELQAMQLRRPPVDPHLRRRLMATPSMGGARPKATVRDGDQFWLVKPILSSDTEDIPRLEHAAQEWGRAVGLNFAQTAYTGFGEDSALSVMRSLRFDRQHGLRVMTLSAASLLQTEYPGHSGSSAWSYPNLARTLTMIGAPQEDAIELFCRMIFNAVIGNDDDHPRNHAIHYLHDQGRWRLTPAFDVVPNPDFIPQYLAMELSHGSRQISRANALHDAKAFGLSGDEEAAELLDGLLARIEGQFDQVRLLLGPRLESLMQERLSEGLRRMRSYRIST